MAPFDMSPPWKKYPELPQGDLGWRMGYGEDYLDQFNLWWKSLSAVEKRAYASSNPAPTDWSGFYEDEIEDNPAPSNSTTPLTSYTSSDFGEALKAGGWKEVVPHIEFRKDQRRLVFDNSSWIELGTDASPRIFDVPLPERHLAEWTINLIEHLFTTDEARRSQSVSTANFTQRRKQRTGAGWTARAIALAAFIAAVWFLLTLVANNGFDFALPAWLDFSARSAAN